MIRHYARMLSVWSLTWAGNMQAPRTIKSILTPLRPARMRLWINASSVSAFILATNRPLYPVPRRPQGVDLGDELAVQISSKTTACAARAN